MSLRDEHAALRSVRAKLKAAERETGIPNVEVATAARPGHLRLRCVRPPRDLQLLIGGKITPTGEFGGVAARARSQRVGYTGWDGVDTQGLVFETLVLGSMINRRSIEPEISKLAAVTSAAYYVDDGSGDGPPVIAAYGPPPVAGLYRCADLTHTRTEYTADGRSRCLVEVTLTLLRYTASDELASPLALAQQAAAAAARRQALNAEERAETAARTALRKK